MVTTGNVNHNHCVKADPKDPLPFCYTTDPNVRYEYCDCGESSNGGDYSDDRYIAPGVYAGYNGYHQYGHRPLNNGAYGGMYNPSNSGYSPWVSPYNSYRPYNPFEPYGYGGQQEWSPGQGLCRASTTVKGIVIRKSTISESIIQSIIYYHASTSQFSIE